MSLTVKVTVEEASDSEDDGEEGGCFTNRSNTNIAVPPSPGQLPLPDSFLVKKRLSVHLERRKGSTADHFKELGTAFSFLTQSVLPPEDPSIDEIQNVYSFHAKDLNGNDVSLDKYRNQVLIIVNVASECGLTQVSYDHLNYLHDKFHDKGLRILAFPCNQFGSQEPGDEMQISKFVAEQNVKFDVFTKIDVNGFDAHPLFLYLQKKLSGSITNDLKWNFTKFLINKSGVPVNRYSPMTPPKDMEANIVELLTQ